MTSIAIVGMACRYADAGSPEELWETVLARRRAFRRIPAERLSLADYFSTDPEDLDSIYCRYAAVLEGYRFDRVRFRVSASTFETADPAHWLALDVADRALADAGFPQAEGLPRQTTGVLVGNSLTGDGSRASSLRLRWPFVRRVAEQVLRAEGHDEAGLGRLLARLEDSYKRPFPAVSEETLAGGLSNTIAGRICSHFDLQGGGFTLDGACASSLLAVTNACTALVAGDLDVALAGGVDLSLDPFELVGFARTQALARDTMRVFDRRPTGFIPGEGCGFVVLMRGEDALAQGRPIHALIRGWGVSSDGAGGITRPEEAGQILALRRAYHRAGFGAAAVGYFEGHGTGTAVGDATELRTLARARREDDPLAPAAVVGSLKANIGHTKAAAGVAGLIKATMVVGRGILPPNTGCEDPHPIFAEPPATLSILGGARPWTSPGRLRAGVSAMGFGGINTHVVLEAPPESAPAGLSTADLRLLASSQDLEAFFFAAPTVPELGREIATLRPLADRLSFAELGDLATRLAAEARHGAPVRAAVLARRPEELAARLDELGGRLDSPTRGRAGGGQVFFGEGRRRPRIGLLFPGQGSPLNRDGGRWVQRFPALRAIWAEAEIEPGPETADTANAQPAIVAASCAGLALLEDAGVDAAVAIGHSLGELVALHWAGAFARPTLLRLARQRGRAMAELPGPSGAMVSLAAPPALASELIAGLGLTVAAYNAPRQTVVSGEREAALRLLERAAASGVEARLLNVSHAFHSPLVAAATATLGRALDAELLRPPRRQVVSTITGARLDGEADLAALLRRQVTEPVRFGEAVQAAAEVDLWIEVGPGRALGDLVRQWSDRPAYSVDAGGRSLEGLLAALAAAWAQGAPVDPRILARDRFTRPLPAGRELSFLESFCEKVPAAGVLPPPSPEPAAGPARSQRVPPEEGPVPLAAGSTLEVVRRLVAERTELPAETIKADQRLLADLHLNSLSVGHLLAEACRQLGIEPPRAPNEFATSTLGEVARALEEMGSHGGAHGGPEASLQGLESWVRAFTLELVPRPLPARAPTSAAGKWQVLSAVGDPLGGSLGEALDEQVGGVGVALCLPPDPDGRQLGLLLAAARAALAQPADRLLLVQHGGGGSAFVRSLHHEIPGLATSIVDVPFGDPRSLQWIVAEARAARGLSEAVWGADGVRREPVLRLVPGAPGAPAESLPLAPGDLLLVTGGGKGIAAECGLAIARQCGARLALLGRSSPASDRELAANLERLAAAGVEHLYVAADVTDRAAVRTALARIERELGPVSALLHAAGINLPASLARLDEAGLRATLAPKIDGLDHLLAALDADRLKLLVGFGSLIARTGMEGEAHYGLANEWLARRIEAFQANHPDCRCLTLEWSVWSGVGMGERLGRVEALLRRGITPITPEIGVEWFLRLVRQGSPRPSVVVSGRLGERPNPRVEGPELPLGRFLEHPRVHYPGIELLVDAELSSDTDPYVGDHALHGERLLPAVIGLEAMAQAAQAVTGRRELPVFEEVRFRRPVMVPATGKTVVRTVAQVRPGGDLVEVSVRSADSGFQVDCFRALCRFAGPAEAAPRNGRGAGVTAPLPLDPGGDLYGSLLFQRGRFHRLREFGHLSARQCLATIGPDGGTEWFSPYLPQRLLLGDPGARDAALHAIQACIPHAVVLPIGAERLEPAFLDPHLPWTLQARERYRQGNRLVYDLDVIGEDGSVRERWHGLELQIVESDRLPDSWAVPLVAPYLERRLEELRPPSPVSVVVERAAAAAPRNGSDQVLGKLLGDGWRLRRRPDGKPEAIAPAGSRSPSARQVSLARSGDLLFATSGDGALGCDVEAVVPRGAERWEQLLPAPRMGLCRELGSHPGEDADSAATRVWAAMECLKKAGVAPDAPLTLEDRLGQGWIVLRSGPFRVPTLLTRVKGYDAPMVFAVLTPEPARHPEEN